MKINNDINQIINSLKPDLLVIDEIIIKFSVGKSDLIKQIVKHLISSGGKRIRPILLILSSKMLQEKEDRDAKLKIYNLSAAIELIHTATLLHDDVVDSSQIRRGKKTANSIWDNKPSILVGDYIFSIAFQLMVNVGDLAILDLLAKTSGAMADGEVMQIEHSQDINISQEKYFEIIHSKTAILFSAATKCAAIINRGNIQEIEMLKNFGENLGIIFQIIDDVLDYSGVAENIGKNVGDDFFEGKVTLPIILAYEKASIEDKIQIKNIFQENLISSEKNVENFSKIVALINKYQGLEECMNIAIKYKNIAENNLSIFSDSIYKKYLLQILEYSFNRKS